MNHNNLSLEDIKLNFIEFIKLLHNKKILQSYLLNSTFFFIKYKDNFYTFYLPFFLNSFGFHSAFPYVPLLSISQNYSMADTNNYVYVIPENIETVTFDLNINLINDNDNSTDFNNYICSSETSLNFDTSFENISSTHSDVYSYENLDPKYSLFMPSRLENLSNLSTNLFYSLIENSSMSSTTVGSLTDFYHNYSEITDDEEYFDISFIKKYSSRETFKILSCFGLSAREIHNSFNFISIKDNSFEIINNPKYYHLYSNADFYRYISDMKIIALLLDNEIYPHGYLMPNDIFIPNLIYKLQEDVACDLCKEDFIKGVHLMKVICCNKIICFECAKQYIESRLYSDFYTISPYDDVLCPFCRKLFCK